MRPQQRDWFFSRTNGAPDHTPAEILGAFVLTVADDLNVVTAHAPDLLRRLQFAEPFASQTLRAAWAEVAQMVPGLIRRVPELPQEGLYRVGLVGPQLELKVTAWDESRRSLVEILGEQEPIEMEFEPRLEMLLEYDDALVAAPVFAPRLHIPGLGPALFWPRRLLRRLAKTLEYADTILGSLAPLLPIIEPLKEYKETVEKVIGDAAEIRPQ